MPRIIKTKGGSIEVGERIKSRRLMLGMSQGTLGDKLGITFQQIQKYEKGTNELSIGRMKAMAAALKMPPAYFIADNTVVSQDDIRLIQTPAARKMLTAFNKVQNTKAQERLIALVETYAEAPTKKR